MIAAVLLGAGTGLGLWSLSLWLAPPRPSLHRVLAESLASTGEVGPARSWTVAGHDNVETENRWLRLVRPLLPALQAVGLPSERLRRDLAVTGTDIDEHLARKTLYGVAGLLAPAIAGLGRAALGSPPAPQAPVVAALALAAAGFLYPDIRVRAEATRARRDFVHALSAYLDLVVISLAGGAGIDSALHDAASIGRGWAFDQLRRALEAARLTRVTAWSTLRQLGDHLGVRELSELAAATTLAGVEGAKVRASFTARAASLRTHLLTDAEKDAKSATGRMVLPWLLLFLGFLIFLGYPGLHEFTSVLHR